MRCIALFTGSFLCSEVFKRLINGYSASKGVGCMYKKQEKYLIILSFFVAAIMLLSIVGRIFGS